MLNVIGVVVFNTSMVNWTGRSICPWYMCIVLYVECISGVVVFHTSMVNVKEGALVYVHSAIC